MAKQTSIKHLERLQAKRAQFLETPAKVARKAVRQENEALKDLLNDAYGSHAVGHYYKVENDRIVIEAADESSMNKAVAFFTSRGIKVKTDDEKHQTFVDLSTQDNVEKLVRMLANQIRVDVHMKHFELAQPKVNGTSIKTFTSTDKKLKNVTEVLNDAALPGNFTGHLDRLKMKLQEACDNAKTLGCNFKQVIAVDIERLEQLREAAKETVFHVDPDKRHDEKTFEKIFVGLGRGRA